MTELTLEQLPKAFAQFYNEWQREKGNIAKPKAEVDQWFDINELSQYLPEHLAKPTIYGLVAQRKIPFHKRSKKLTFLKSEIDAWLKSSKRRTRNEIFQEADAAITK